jgi:hypothetical protein
MGGRGAAVGNAQIGGLNIGHLTKEQFFSSLSGWSEKSLKGLQNDVAWFTKNIGYAAIRANETDKAKRANQRIEKAIEDSNSNWGSDPLYRGMTLTQKQLDDYISDYKAGRKKKQKGISSWTSDKSRAEMFASGSATKKSVVFIESSNQTKSAISIRALSAHPTWEHEVAYSGKANFKITSIKTEKFYTRELTVIRVKEVKK